MSTPHTQQAMRRAGAAVVSAALAAVALSSPLGAQAPSGQWTVTTRSGAISFDRAASLKTAPFIGLDAEYGIRKYLAIGSSVHVARPNTREGDFLTTLTYGVATAGDTTFIYEVGQAVNVIEGEVTAVVRYPASRFVPFAAAGFGGYGLFMDPQTNRGAKRANGTSASIGGGVAVRLSDRAGLQFDVRNMSMFNFRRSDLDPAAGRNPNTIFGEEFGTPPSSKKTVNNLVFTIGFRYVPGGNVSDDPRDPNAPREDRQ